MAATVSATSALFSFLRRRELILGMIGVQASMQKRMKNTFSVSLRFIAVLVNVFVNMDSRAMPISERSSNLKSTQPKNTITSVTIVRGILSQMGGFLRSFSTNFSRMRNRKK